MELSSQLSKTVHAHTAYQASAQTATSIYLRRLTAAGTNSRWAIQSTPLAGERYGDLDRSELHQPQEFKLESAEGTAASFLVGMRFARGGPVPLRSVAAANGEGFENPEADNAWTIVFRSTAGPLAIGKLSTDGEILATKRGKTGTAIFSVRARSVSEGGKAIFEASSPVTASLERSPGVIEFHCFFARMSNLKIRVKQPPTEVELDGNHLQPRVSNGLLEANNLAPGEHVVRIRD